MPHYYIMSEHTIKNPFENIPQDKATYVVQSYYDQNDVLVSQTKFHICDGQPDNIQNLTSDEIKHLLVIHGIWPQYTKRIKNLERVEQEFWKLYKQQVNLVKKGKILEDIANLQPIVSNCYAGAKELLASNKTELNN